MGRMHDKTVVVTGASSGLGRAMSTLFIEEGARVYAAARRSELLAALANDLGENLTPVVVDVTVPGDVERLYQHVRADGREIDVVVANAGGTERVLLEEVTAEHLEREWALNVTGTFNTVQKALPLLRPGASVILLGSTAADKGSVGTGVYAASKAAVRSFGRTWANELRARSVRVNTISPGPVQTEALDGSVRDQRLIPEAMKTLDPDEVTRRIYADLTARIPVGRVGDPREVARLALFLATDESSFITGANIYIDGGLTQV